MRTGMRVWAAAIAALLLGVGAAQAQDCGLKQYDSLTMEVYPDRLLLPVTLGTVPKKMILRLEDAVNGMDAAAASALDLRITSIPPNIHFHRGGEEITRIAHVPEMHFGRQTMKNVEFLMVRAGHYDDEAVGDLGTQMFQKVDYELDIAGAKFNLFSPDHCPGKTVYWTKTPFAELPLKPSPELTYIRTEMMLDDHPVTVALSTVGRSRIGMNAMRRLFNVDENSPELTVVGQDLLGHKTYRYAFKTLTAGGLTINNPAIMVYDEEPRPGCNDKLHFAMPEPSAFHTSDRPQLARCFGGDDAVLGLSVLSKLHIYVSGQEKKLYLTSAEAK